MYDYVALKIIANPCDETITDLLAAYLAESDYDTFEPVESGLTAYIRKDKYDRDFVEEIIKEFPIDTRLCFTTNQIEGEDWNKEWEQNYFKPIRIGDRLVIRSSFHETFPDIPLEIIIDPKMAFGTGHHSTTSGMSRMLLEEDLKGKSVIDMGTGTGILSILAEKLGACDITGIDIDEFAIENARENGSLNNVDIKWIVGDDKVLGNLESVDIFLANINLNIIRDNLNKFVKKLKRGGRIFLSGFLETDREAILNETEKYDLTLIKELNQDKWMTMVFEKR